MLPGTELRPVSFNKRQQDEEAFFQNIHGTCMFPQCLPVSQMGNIVWETLFPVSGFVFKMQHYAYATRQGILTKIRAIKVSW